MKAVGAIQARGYEVMNQTGDNNKKELTCVQHLIMTKHCEKHFLRINSFYLYISLMPQIRKQNGKVRSPRSGSYSCPNSNPAVWLPSPPPSPLPWHMPTRI